MGAELKNIVASHSNIALDEINTVIEYEDCLLYTSPIIRLNGISEIMANRKRRSMYFFTFEV